MKDGKQEQEFLSLPSWLAAMAFAVILAPATLLDAQEKAPAKAEAKPAEVEPEEKVELREGRRRAEQSLEDRMKILEEEIERLKLGKATRKEYKSKDGLGPAASEVYWKGEGLTWGGYGEAKFKHFKKKRNESRAGCLAFLDNVTERESCFNDYARNRGKPNDVTDLHRFILYAGYRFNDWILLNTEIEYEHAGFEEATITDGTGKSNSTTIPEVFVEFMYVDFKIREEFQVAVGLHLIPMGITNLLHEPTTFYPVERPLTESAIIPTTWREMGMIVHGNVGEKFVYRAGVVNGGRANNSSASNWLRENRTKGSKSRMDGLAGVVSADLKPWQELTLGASYYQGQHGQNEVLGVSPGARTKLIDPNDPNSKIKLVTASTTTGNLKVVQEYSLEDSLQDEISRFTPVTVHIAEGHFLFEKGAFTARALAARGWMNEEDTRALNKKTGQNVGMVAEGGYLELGYDVFSLLGIPDQRLVLFVRPERINTQRQTARYGLNDQILDYICTEESLSRCRTFDDLSGGRSVGIITNDLEKAANAELKKQGHAYRMGGGANPVNDRTVVTAGVAYYPHPNVVLKLDYEKHQSATTYHKDIEQRNSSNNKMDRVNFGLGFIF